jgi:hypothetical protein
MAAEAAAKEAIISLSIRFASQVYELNLAISPLRIRGFSRGRTATTTSARPAVLNRKFTD